MDADEVSIREQNFHSQVREYTICFLLFAILYIVSYFIIRRYKRKADEQEDEDAIVNRISLFLSTFTLAVSAGAVLLLPFSIISNEILLSFPQSYYIQWLNGSLIHGLWNLASLFSNLCLFILMPFAFFFLESEGFAGLKKGIKARILETLVMLILLALLILGIVWVASALIDNDAASMESLYDLWEFYLPYLYSCISLMGCLLLLLCTPVGLSRMFTVMGQLLVKPTILEDLDEQIYIITLEEEAIMRRLNGGFSAVEYNTKQLEQELNNVKSMKTKLERRKKASAWERNLVYPAVMILLLIETAFSVLLVACNILRLLVDETAMPKGSRGPGIGNASLSTFGFVGAALEIILILYPFFHEAILSGCTNPLELPAYRNPDGPRPSHLPARLKNLPVPAVRPGLIALGVSFVFYYCLTVYLPCSVHRPESLGRRAVYKNKQTNK
ncbi:limb region 1 protein homolog isoform 2-T2 [Vipera latastei]